MCFIGFMNLRCVYGWRLRCLFVLLYWLGCRGRFSIALNFFGSVCFGFEFKWIYLVVSLLVSQFVGFT